MKKTPFVTKEQLDEIMKSYPTPFHLYDEKGIRENAKALKEAFSNIIRNRLMTLATIITLAAGLFLFGLTSALTLNVFSITFTNASFCSAFAFFATTENIG